MLTEPASARLVIPFPSQSPQTLDGPRPKPRGAGGDASDDAGPRHLLVDSTGLKLIGAGEWLVEKHGTKRRRSWRKMHLGVDAETGRIVAATLTDRADAARPPPATHRREGQDGVAKSVGV